MQEGAGPAQTYFLHADMLGSIRAVTDSAGRVVARFDYEPFGLLTEESGPASAGAERYTGKPLDAELGLYYFGARYYDPGLGRFVTADPARDGLNWYVYCDNNPAARVDPDGKQSTEAVAAGAVWLCLVDGPLPLGDAIYVSLVGLTATFEYAPAVLDKLAAVGDQAMDSLRMLFSDNNRLKSQVSGLTKPIRDHLDKLAGRAPKSEGDPRIPRNRSKWVEDAQRAWNNIVERLNKLGKPLPQVLREWGWEKERIDALIQDMIASGIDFADMDRWLR